MMLTNDILTDAYCRLRDTFHATLDGLDENLLAASPADGANNIGWLLWHLTRVQDDHISEMADKQQVWLSHGWYSKFGLPFEPDATGYGMSAEEVRQTKVRPAQLKRYFDAVHDQTIDYIKTLSEDDYTEVIDTAWNPPVTRGMRLVSVLSDDLQHVGQAGYAKGLLNI